MRFRILATADLRAAKELLNSVGWFMPPYVSVGILEMVARRVKQTAGGFTQEELEAMLANVYGVRRMASMVVNRYPRMPIINMYSITISEAVLAHFIGLNHIAVGGLVPVIEGCGRRLAAERGLRSQSHVKEVFRSLSTSAKQEVVERRIGAVNEIIDMLDSFTHFIESYFYSSSQSYPLIDGTNRHGITHGTYSDHDYGRPINFYKTIAAVDFLTFIASLRTSFISGFVPDDTDESVALAARYLKGGSASG